MGREVMNKDELPRGTERILFVDDEETVAEIGEHLLSHLGYQVTVSMSSLDALTLFRADPEAFDLVITDMTMPGMTGDELAKELLRICPDIPVILCTGFATKTEEEKAADLGIRAVVSKPIVLKKIAGVIRKVLDED